MTESTFTRYYPVAMCALLGSTGGLAFTGGVPAWLRAASAVMVVLGVVAAAMVQADAVARRLYDYPRGFYDHDGTLAPEGIIAAYLLTLGTALASGGVVFLAFRAV